MTNIKQLTDEIRCLFLCCKELAQPNETPDTIQAYVLLSGKLIDELIDGTNSLLQGDLCWSPPVLLRVICEKAIEICWIASGDKIDQKIAWLDLDHLRSAKQSVKDIIHFKTRASQPLDTHNALMVEISDRTSFLEKRFPDIQNKRLPNYEQMAREGGVEWLYGTVYRQLCLTVHPNAFGFGPFAYEWNMQRKDFTAVRKHAGSLDYQVWMNMCLLEYSKALNSLFKGPFKRQLETSERKLMTFTHVVW